MKLLKFFIFLILAALFLFSILVSFSLVVFKNISSDLPNISQLRYFKPPRATQLYSYDGKLIGTIFKENRTWISLNQVPLILKEAFFAIEDSRFYKHHGFDIKGILRAAIADLKGEAITQGASTITQQLARNLFLSPKKSIKRKIQEIFLAIQIEKKYTKDEILEFYLNQIYFGAGAYGIQTASSIYFDKGVKSLSLPEAAVLAGLPAAPSLYSPLVNFNLAKERQKLVLERMKLLGYINEEESLKAYKTDLKISNKQYEFHSLSYPYFTTYVLHYLFNKYKSDLIFRGGLKVYTTLNPKMQEIAQNILRKGVNRGLKEGLNCHEGALVALDPGNGYIRAMVGGLEFKTANQFNRAWQARRQPGSAFKVFVYTTAMDSGLYTPKSIISDSPISYRFSDGQVWAPVNNDGKYWGAIPLMKALQFSRNVVAVKLMEKLTPKKVIEYAYKMGIKEPLEPNLSLALGSSVVTPLEMASAFGVLANEGIRVEPTPIKLIIDGEGKILEDNSYPFQEEVLSEETAYTMISMLRQVIEAGTGQMAKIGRPAAGKTGTTNNFRDSWFIGFVPNLTASVWVGNDNYEKMNYSYGGYIPAYIWGEFMKQVLVSAPKLEFNKPKETKSIIICRTSRMRATPNCPSTERIYLKDKLDLPFCKIHTQKSNLNSDNNTNDNKNVKKEKTPKTLAPINTPNIEKLEELPFNQEEISPKSEETLEPESKESLSPDTLKSPPP